MLKLIKSNNPFNYFLAFLFMLGLWAYKFAVMPTAVDTGGMHSYFFRFIYESSKFQYIYTAIAFALTFAFACYLSVSNFRLQIVESGYQLPTLFFTMLAGCLINAQRFIPEMFATLFVSLAILRIFSMYNKYEDIRSSLDVGLLYGFSLLFAYKYIVLLPAIVIVFIIVKPVSWRDLFSFFLSATFVCAIAFCLVWLYGDLNEMLLSVKNEVLTLIFAEKYNYLNYIFFIPVIFSLFVSVLSIFILRVFRKAAEMKYYQSMLVLLVYFGLYVGSPLSSNESVWLMYFPLCYLLSNIVVNARRRVVRGLVFYGLLLCLVVSQILQIMYFDSIF